MQDNINASTSVAPMHAQKSSHNTQFLVLERVYLSLISEERQSSIPSEFQHWIKEFRKGGSGPRVEQGLYRILWIPGSVPELI